MDSSCLVASVDTALDKLWYWMTHTDSFDHVMELPVVISRLFAVRTFCLCSATLANNVELRAEGYNDNAVTSLRSRKKKMREKKRRLRKSLGSLLVRVEGVVNRILDDCSPENVPDDFPFVREPCYEEMDDWYSSLFFFLARYSTSPRADHIKAIAESVVGTLRYYLHTRYSYDFDFKQRIEALEKNIKVMRNIIHFGTLLCYENQEFRCLLNQFEPLAMTAAHFALRLVLNAEDSRHGASHPDDLTSSSLSTVLTYFCNPLLHDKYTLALASLKHSRELCDPSLDLNGYPFVRKMEDCIVSLLSTLLDMAQLRIGVSLEGLQLYARLRLLRILLKRQPNRFDDVKIRNLTPSVVCDAGVRIFSFYQKDDHLLQCYLENSEVIWGEVLEEKVMETSTFNFSETTPVLGFIDFLLEDYLMEVNSSSTVDSSILNCVPKIRQHLGFLKTFMGKLVELRNQQENLHQDIWNLAVQIAYKIEFLIDQLVLGDVLHSFPMSLQSITEYIMVLMSDSLNIFNDEGRQEIFKVQKITQPPHDKVRSISSTQVGDEVVGFESEKASIVNRLLRGFKKLQVVAVVGMPGLGKTTLATKVYTDWYVTHHFPVRVWCSISQEFNRRKVLLELLNQIQPGEGNLKMEEYELSQKLWRSLRQRRYLIFVDDIWDIQAFELLRESLPDDSNQSRILLTSRHEDVVPKGLLDEKPLFLPLLSMDESLELLRRKLFPARKDWPSESHEFGMEIAEYCKGLPLTVVIVAGLLKATEEEGWKDVMKSLRSSTIPDVTDQCKSTIELSYRHLPDHLKPCFLWLGAFPEAHEFSVKKLIWLWIAEGLVRKSEAKSLEAVAAEYLNILIGRSLVMSVKERSIGGVKTCRIHDLLHDFCLRKSKKDYFFHLLEVKEDEEQGHLSSKEFNVPKQPSDEPDFPRRLRIRAEPHHLENYQFFFPGLRCLLFFTPRHPFKNPDVSFIFRILKLLRVLDVGQVYLKELPSEVGLLVQLRYLEIRVLENISLEIGKLSKLETLILHSTAGVSLPGTLWNLQKLRHLYSHPYSNTVLPIDNSDSSCNLLELETLCSLYVRDWSVMEKQMRKFPNIRQMKFELSPHKDGCLNDSMVMDFSFLNQLESLSLSNLCCDTELIFPENIKKLTLSKSNFPWTKISSIAKLPYLEVLKLLRGSFLGDAWHVEEGEFPKLKYLKLESLNLVNWTAASYDLFPKLEKLVLKECLALEEVPECLENVATLETIEVINCPDRVVSVLKRVEEFQKDMGNSFLSLSLFEREKGRGKFGYTFV